MTPPTLDAIEVEPKSPARGAVIWLHGLGADGRDFLPIVDELALPDEFALRWVFPNAPQMAVTINNGMVMRAWYDIVSADFRRHADHDGVMASVVAVERLIAREIARGIPARHLLLGGFSQGGVVALHAGLRAGTLAGIAALSTYLPLAEELPPPSVAPPVFYAHGVADSVVPLALAEAARDVLEARNVAVEFHRYPNLGHGVSLDEIDDLRTWMLARFESSE
ncbi:MAG: prolyl oligopeptidase family serine peptidase [Chromatiales bacterium]|nr:prolyl oligopeptidase family serine peptidase [Chromatiales bacterium]